MKNKLLFVMVWVVRLSHCGPLEDMLLRETRAWFHFHYLLATDSDAAAHYARPDANKLATPDQINQERWRAARMVILSANLLSEHGENRVTTDGSNIAPENAHIRTKVVSLGVLGTRHAVVRAKEVIRELGLPGVD